MTSSLWWKPRQARASGFDLTILHLFHLTRNAVPSSKTIRFLFVLLINSGKISFLLTSLSKWGQKYRGTKSKPFTIINPVSLSLNFLESDIPPWNQQIPPALIPAKMIHFLCACCKREMSQTFFHKLSILSVFPPHT